MDAYRPATGNALVESGLLSEPHRARQGSNGPRFAFQHGQQLVEDANALFGFEALLLDLGDLSPKHPRAAGVPTQSG